MMAVCNLQEDWRRTAELFRDHFTDPVARAYERCAEDLEEWLNQQEDAVLNLKQAAAESGYSSDHLGRLQKAGKIPNAGRPGSPKIRRADLPRKAGPLQPSAPNIHLVPTKTQVVRSVVSQKEASDG
ncbi:hypothetical protein ACFL0I_02535 [Gemmatimonadota bacterium]